MIYDKEFVDTFNQFYPYERYVVKEPKPINDSYDDALLTEIFVKPVKTEDVHNEDVYVKLCCKGVEFRMAFYDFSESVRQEIRFIILNEIGNPGWQSLYTDYEEDEAYDDIIEILKEQKQLITEKYGSCEIKDSWIVDERFLSLMNK